MMRAAQWIGPRLLPVGLLVVGILVLQHHAIEWWTRTVTGSWPGWGRALLLAPWSGWGFSAMWELWNVWSWAEAVPYRATWRGRGWLASALVTSALLVAGPTYELTGPGVREAGKPATAPPSAELEAARNNLAGLEATRDKMLALNMVTALNRADADGKTLHQRITDAGDVVKAAEKAQQAKAADPEPWAYRWGKPAVVALGVMLAQVAVAVCAVVLFGGVRATRVRWQVYEAGPLPGPRPAHASRAETPPPPARAPETAETGPTRPAETLAGAALASAVQTEVERRWPGMAWSKRAGQLGVNKKAMSAVVNYEAWDAKGAHGLDGYVATVRDALWPPETETARTA